MKSIINLFLFLTIALFVSCDKDNSLNINNSDAIIGNWINPVAVDTLVRYERADSLELNNYGLSFKQEGLFFERKTAGKCGTPPVTWGDYDGTWTISDSKINISVDYWGGVASYEWKLIDVDKNYLTVWVAKMEFPTGE